jgi:flagellar basal body-associated protein FliL
VSARRRQSYKYMEEEHEQKPELEQRARSIKDQLVKLVLEPLIVH